MSNQNKKKENRAKAWKNCLIRTRNFFLNCKEGLLKFIKEYYIHCFVFLLATAGAHYKLGISATFITVLVLFTAFLTYYRTKKITSESIKVYSFIKRLMLGLLYSSVIIFSIIFVSDLVSKVTSDEYYLTINDLPQSFIEKGLTKKVLLERFSNRSDSIRNSDQSMTDLQGPQDDATIKLEAMGNAVYIDQFVLWLRSTFGIRRNLKYTFGEDENHNVFCYGKVEKDDETFMIKKKSFVYNDSLPFSKSIDSLINYSTFHSFAVVDPGKLSRFYRNDLKQLKNIGDYISSNNYDYNPIVRLNFYRNIGNHYFNKQQYFKANESYSKAFDFVKDVELDGNEEQYFGFVDNYVLNKIFMGQGAQAIKFLKEQKPNYTIDANLGLSHALLGNHKEAIHYYEFARKELTKLSPNQEEYNYELTEEPFITFHLIHLYLTTNELEKAQRLLLEIAAQPRYETLFSEKHWFAYYHILNNVVGISKLSDEVKKLDNATQSNLTLLKMALAGKFTDDYVKNNTSYGFSSNEFFSNERILIDNYPKSVLAQLQIRNKYDRPESGGQFVEIFADSIPYFQLQTINKELDYTSESGIDNFEKAINILYQETSYDQEYLKYRHLIYLNGYKNIFNENDASKEKIENLKTNLDRDYLQSKMAFFDSTVLDEDIWYDDYVFEKKVLNVLEQRISQYSTSTFYQSLIPTVRTGSLWIQFQEKRDSALVLNNFDASYGILNDITTTSYDHVDAWLYKQALHIYKYEKISTDIEKILLDLYDDDSLMMTRDLSEVLQKLEQPQLAMDIILDAYKNDPKVYENNDLKAVPYINRGLVLSYLNAYSTLSISNAFPYASDYFNEYVYCFQSGILDEKNTDYEAYKKNLSKIFADSFLIKAQELFLSKNQPYQDYPIYRQRSKDIDIALSITKAIKNGLDREEIHPSLSSYILSNQELNKILLSNGIVLTETSGFKPNNDVLIKTIPGTNSKFKQLIK